LRLGAILMMVLLAGCAGTRPQGFSPLAALQSHDDRRTCVKDTGTHISDDPACISLGHSYSVETIRSTGAVDVEHALQDLDMAITSAPSHARLRVR